MSASLVGSEMCIRDRVCDVVVRGSRRDPRAGCRALYGSPADPESARADCGTAGGLRRHRMKRRPARHPR
eukprot:13722012-Alexandrium_andersonii.AAC.1